MKVELIKISDFQRRRWGGGGGGTPLCPQAIRNHIRSANSGTLTGPRSATQGGMKPIYAIAQARESKKRPAPRSEPKKAHDKKRSWAKEETEC